MKAPGLVLQLTFLVIVICGVRQETTACSCKIPTVCEAFNRTTAVFIGRPIQASQKREDVFGGKTYVAFFGEVIFEVIEPFSGVTSRLVSVWASGGGMCWDISFYLGETYLVYADEREDKKLWAGGCGRTRTLRPISIDSSDNPSYQQYRRDLQKEYDNELEFLRNAVMKKLSGARIYGQAISFQRMLGRNGESRETSFLAGVTIKIEGQRQSLKVKTDSEGKFDIRGLEPGNYKVTPLSLEGHVPSQSDHLNKELTLRDGGCVQLRLTFDPAYQVNGRVFDAEGKPLAGVEMSLISEKWREEDEINDGDINSYQTLNGQTDNDGRYKIEGVEPGRYLLGVNITKPSPKSPYPRFFYPDVSDVKQAEVITVEPGKTSGPFDLHLTQTLEKYTIQGVVVWPDDTPVVGANIHLRAPGGSRGECGTTTDEQGRFTLEGLKDYEYELHVYWSNKDLKNSDEIKKSPPGWSAATAEMESLKVEGNVKDLKLVLSKEW